MGPQFAAERVRQVRQVRQVEQDRLELSPEEAGGFGPLRN
jgi:hypothetical protein